MDGTQMGQTLTTNPDYVYSEWHTCFRPENLLSRLDSTQPSTCESCRHEKIAIVLNLKRANFISEIINLHKSGKVGVAWGLYLNTLPSLAQMLNY